MNTEETQMTEQPWAARKVVSVLTVSSLLDGEYGLREVCLSVPCVVGEMGVARVLEARLPPGEQSALERSAGVLRGAMGEIDSHVHRGASDPLE
jgi:malate/lactate dehydrogenase